MLDEDILKELINNHPEFEKFEFLKNYGVYKAGWIHHLSREGENIMEYLLNHLSNGLGITKNELIDKIKVKTRRKKEEEREDGPLYTYGASASTLRHDKGKEEPQDIDSKITALIKEHYALRE